jgi:hypothetical protein
MAQSGKKHLVTFREIPCPQGVDVRTWADLNDQIKKIALAQNTTVVAPVVEKPSVPKQVLSAPPVIKEKKWAYFKGNGLIDDDVAELHVMGDLLARRRTPHIVEIEYNTPAAPDPFVPAYWVPARVGMWATHDFTPIGNAQTAMRVEWLLYWAGGAVGYLLQFGTTTAAANSFSVIASNTNWSFDAYNTNKVTMPTPSIGMHVVIMEFDGNNVGNGIAQWNIWVDGVLQTLTAVVNGNINGILPALLYASGAEYRDPVIAAVITPFQGAIVTERLYTGITGDSTITPPYTTLVMWTDARVIDESEFVENGKVVLHQTAPDPAPGPGNTTILPWILSTRSSIVALDATGGTTLPLNAPRITRVYAFPGLATIQCGGVPLGGVDVDWIVATPNVARATNLAYVNEDKWSLFHGKQLADLDAVSPIWVKEVQSYSNPVTLSLP